MRCSKLFFMAAIFAMAFSVMVGAAGATVVNSLPGGSVITMPAVDAFGAGPQAFGPGITWTSTNAMTQGGSVFGFTGMYGFGDNGIWDGNLGPMAGVNSSYDEYGVIDTMTFAFSKPVSAVGGFLNYVPGRNPAVISVYDSGMNLIESTTLDFITDGSANSGYFYGFQESKPDISYFTLTDDYIGITNLTTSSSVPEPSTVALFGAGLAGIGILRRRFGK